MYSSAGGFLSGLGWDVAMFPQALTKQVNVMYRTLEDIAARIGVRTPVQHAILSGYISVITGLTEFILSIMAGEASTGIPIHVTNRSHSLGWRI